MTKAPTRQLSSDSQKSLGSLTRGGNNTNTNNSRSNSIEITSETTLNQLRGLESNVDQMGRSLNFLNLDHQRRLSSLHDKTKTVGGASNRQALMQLRLRRFKKKVSSQPGASDKQLMERLYSSDSALLTAPHAKDASHKRHDVWFKSLYPKQGALEKLDEAEHELEESQRSQDDDENNNMVSPHASIMDMSMNTSQSDMWLFDANQSAPGYLTSERRRG